MMKVITGDSYITNQGLIVVCDPDRLNCVRIVPGEHVVYEGKEYIFKGAVQMPTTRDEWPVLLAEV